MNKEEILKLHKLSEINQYHWLRENKILQDREISNEWGIVEESLADLAFRLRDEIGSLEGWYDVWEVLEAHMDIPSVYAAKPIHWIQAALLARLKGQDDEAETH